MKDSMLENLLKTIADITGETDGAFSEGTSKGEPDLPA